MTPFIRSSAEEHILHQVEWYAEQGVPEIARRFHAAVVEAINVLVGMPAAGTPRHTRNPSLEGLRTWPVKGFDEFRIYYLAPPGSLSIIRVLHDKRDTGAILEGQTVEDPSLH